MVTSNKWLVNSDSVLQKRLNNQNKQQCKHNVGKNLVGNKCEISSFFWNPLTGGDSPTLISLKEVGKEDVQTAKKKE